MFGDLNDCYGKALYEEIAEANRLERELIDAGDREAENYYASMAQEEQAESDPVISDIPSAKSGACFHGEEWVRCPHCNTGVQLVGKTPVTRIGIYSIYKCSCGKMFKVA